MPEKTEFVQILMQKFYSASPDGLRVATMPGWPGRMILGPRTRLDDALSLMSPLSESTEVAPIPGVYFLTRKMPQALYIGQSGALSTRLRSHHANRPDWEQFVIASCTDTQLQMDIADTGYLEWKLIGQARNAKQITLENQNNPSSPRVSEEKKFQLDPWLVGILQISSLLGMKYFIDKTQEDTLLEGDSSTIFELNLPHRGGQAFGRHANGNFVALAGSSAIGPWIGKSEGNDKAKALLQELINDGTIVQFDDGYRFTRDYEFNSTSLAAKVISGGPRSGPGSWRVQGTKMTYKEWHSAGSGVDSDMDK